MAKKNDLDFPFYVYLDDFYETNRGKIKQNYKKLTRKFLDFNNPENAKVFLRKPQYKALEIYVFLKEYLDNAKVQDIFNDWFEGNEKFSGRMKNIIHTGEQLSFAEVDAGVYKKVFDSMKEFEQNYSNYIFALTMGVGKTILMATCIFYEFLLANKFPDDTKYCHNALVFAPDMTVLQSLKEIMTFDKAKVVPPEYVNWLDSNLKFHFLDDTGTTLSVIEKSDFNIIISNTQKIILKKQHKEKTDTQRLFDLDISADPDSTKGRFSDLTGDIDNMPENENDLTTNQRFEKLTRIRQLGIYVDEAHHAFGTKLEKDLKESGATSLRLTINNLAEALKKAGTNVVACYNYTGTPYVKNRLLPEVVCAYSLKDAIYNNYLKEVEVKSYSNSKSAEFIKTTLAHFFDKHKDKRYEGMLPKIAIFATTIDELEKEVKPQVEETLLSLGFSTEKVLVNHEGATNDDIREFKQLDTVSSGKQVILLVNKGKEGWNCRSLFSVALHRKPKSNIFVLQASMRCLRAITDIQQKAYVYLSDENRDILEKELTANFNITINDMKTPTDNKQVYEIQPVPPPVKIKLKKIKKTYDIKRKDVLDGIDFELAKALSNENTEKYRIIETSVSLDRIDESKGQKRDVTIDVKNTTCYSELTLVAEIARYLNESCILVSKVLTKSVDGTAKVVEAVSTFNELLYDWIVPRIFNHLYSLEEETTTEEVEVELVRTPPSDPGYYLVRAKRDLTAHIKDTLYKDLSSKSFHLNYYCFDSQPEKALFWNLLNEKDVGKVYFTGMLTHGQSDFRIPYIDPESHTVRNYYPDFLIEAEDGHITIIEVKGDNKVDDAVVQAKAEYARQLAVESGMSYSIIRGSECENWRYSKWIKEFRNS